MSSSPSHSTDDFYDSPEEALEDFRSLISDFLIQITSKGIEFKPNIDKSGLIDFLNLAHFLLKQDKLPVRVSREQLEAATQEAENRINDVRVEVKISLNPEEQSNSAGIQASIKNFIDMVRRGELHPFNTPKTGAEKLPGAEKAQKKRAKEMRRLAVFIDDHRLDIKKNRPGIRHNLDEIKRRGQIILDKFRHSIEEGRADELIEAIDLMYEMGRQYDIDHEYLEGRASPTGRRYVAAYKFVLASFALTHPIPFSPEMLESLNNIAANDARYEWLKGKSFVQVMIDAHYQKETLEGADDEFLARLMDLELKRPQASTRQGPEKKSTRRHMGFPNWNQKTKGGSSTTPCDRQTSNPTPPRPKTPPTHQSTFTPKKPGGRGDRRHRGGSGRNPLKMA